MKFVKEDELKSIEIQAKSVEMALEEGLEKLGVQMGDVDIEILSQGGMFKKAKVKLTLKDGVKAKKEEPKPEPKQESVKQESAREEKPNPEQVKKEKPNPEAKPKPAPRPVTPKVPGEGSVKLDICEKFVKGLLSALGSEAITSVESTDQDHTIHINGGDVGRLIGKGGEAMYALQTLVTSIAISNQNGDTRRVFVDIEGYKEKRAETLKGLALKKAEYVKKSGRFVKLEPMTPRERAIVHTALQDIEGVRSYSTGQGNSRCVVIAPPRNEEESQ
ncbi:MAG: KH domain-containing protein [Firmicutes bacterium]|nr:KH domain-containing protein [Bacillota bacterium]